MIFVFGIFPMADVNRGGPLVEYERKIAAGELVDGDACQVYQEFSSLCISNKFCFIMCIIYEFSFTSVDQIHNSTVNRFLNSEWFVAGCIAAE